MPEKDQINSSITAAPIGFWDSGVGGLTVWNPFFGEIPQESTIYIADQAYCPYGPRTAEEIIRRAHKITDWFIQQGCKMIVIVCNTATAAAINCLRACYDIPFVGMEPAVKPAVDRSRSGVVAVLATVGTFDGGLYNKTRSHTIKAIKQSRNEEVTVIEQVGEGWVEAVEEGSIESPQTREMIRCQLLPLLEQGADQIVLGCTHYPFLISVIDDLLSKELAPYCQDRKVEIIDPSGAIVERIRFLLDQDGIAAPENQKGRHQFYSTSSPESLRRMLRSLGFDIFANETKTLIID